MIEELDSSGHTTVCDALDPSSLAVEPEAFSLDSPAPTVIAPAIPVRLWRWLRFGRVRVPVLLMTAVLTGAAATTSAQLWEQYQERRAARATVSLIGDVGTDLSGERSYTADASDGTQVSTQGTVLVTNIGPAPVLIVDLRGSQPGATISLLPGPATVMPGKTTYVNVKLALHCPTASFQLPIPLTVSVRAADGHQEIDLVSVDARPWNEVCAPGGAGG